MNFDDGEVWSRTLKMYTEDVPLLFSLRFLYLTIIFVLSFISFVYSFEICQRRSAPNVLHQEQP